MGGVDAPLGRRAALPRRRARHVRLRHGRRRRAGIEVVGDAAALAVVAPWHTTSPEILVPRPDAEPERVRPEPVDPYARELEELSAAIEGGPPARLGRADALGQARAIDALYRAAAEGRAITL